MEASGIYIGDGGPIFLDEECSDIYLRIKEASAYRKRADIRRGLWANRDVTTMNLHCGNIQMELLNITARFFARNTLLGRRFDSMPFLSMLPGERALGISRGLHPARLAFPILRRDRDAWRYLVVGSDSASPNVLCSRYIACELDIPPPNFYLFPGRALVAYAPGAPIMPISKWILETPVRFLA